MPWQITAIVVVAVPVGFVGLWVFVCALMGFMTGWYSLQARYPATDEPSLFTLDFVSGSMGPLGMSLRYVLKLEACPSSLRVSMLPLFGPFHRPFQVPWNEIDARDTQFLMFERTRLGFGSPEDGQLTVIRSVWERLAIAAAPSSTSPSR